MSNTWIVSFIGSLYELVGFATQDEALIAFLSNFGDVNGATSFMDALSMICSQKGMTVEDIQGLLDGCSIDHAMVDVL
jgi:hypothetical protein